MQRTSASRAAPEPSPPAGLRILLVTQMWPGPDAPDLGIFVAQTAGELERQGHVVERVKIDRRGGSMSKYLRLGWQAVGRALRSRPDVVYAHFLVPAGTLAALAATLARVPLVVTAHGTDVRNIGRSRGIATLTRGTVARAERVVAVSEFLRRGLVERLGVGPERIEVIDSGVDLGRFRGADPAAARRRLGLAGAGPFYLCVGTLDERKNVVALAEAFEALGRGQLIFVGDGPLRDRIAERPGVQVVGRVPHTEVPNWIGACDVLCQPSLEEPFGQAVLEAMAGERSVLATSIGGPPEFVTAAAGVLVDPYDVESIRVGLERAAALPSPNPAAREAAAEHDVRLQAARVARVLREARDAAFPGGARAGEGDADHGSDLRRG
ncbi:MAG: Glycosyl transferase, group 1 [uncultured Solirubrobacterales bacterium]|uniref:Glycosyl transferase, group 1 n=1 Tax=uncultured Solirubrobacterales bacterium TaxID=768556 RepID=A0A6J4S904_9ACTN|nr:MAG: Glycosyl transferase, group 1 [uncultured Solirubrobacterales bacterium]